SPSLRRTDRVEVIELAQPRRQPLALRQRMQVRAREAILLHHPRAHLGRLLVLEPAMGIAHLDTEERLAHVLAAGFRIFHGAARRRLPVRWPTASARPSSVSRNIGNSLPMVCAVPRHTRSGPGL